MKREGYNPKPFRYRQGERSRLGEDDLASRALVKLLADCIGVDSSAFKLPLVSEPTAGASGNVDVVLEASEPAGDPIDDLVAGRVQCVELGLGGNVVVGAPRTGKVGCRDQ